jgi:anti-sigma factor RsiW
MKCSFEILVRYLNKKLDVDEKLRLFDHLDHCEACFEAVYLLSRDRDRIYYIQRPLKRAVS